MAPFTFVDTHNMVTYLYKSDASEGFDQVVDFLNAQVIQYALMVNPTIYVSCIKQFWTTASIKKANDCLSAKRNAWNEFSCCMAYAVICLATGRKINFSKYIFDSMVRNVNSPKTYVTLSQKVAELEQDKHTQALKIIKLKKRVKKFEKKKSRSSCLKRLRKGGKIAEINADEDITLVDKETQGDMDDELQGRIDDVSAATKDVNAAKPTVFDDEEVTLTQIQEKNLDNIKKYQNLKRKPVSIAQARKNMIIYLKNMAGYKMEHFKAEEEGQEVREEEVKEDASKQGGKIAEINVDEDITLVDKETQGDMDDELQGRIDDVSAATKDVNAAKPTVFDDEEVTLTQIQEKNLDNIKKYQNLKRKPVSIAQARKNMIIYLKNMAGYKMEHFKGRSFLRTGRALIDVYGEEITLRVNDESITFNLNQTMRYSSTYNDTSVNRVDVIDVTCEDFVQDVLYFQYNSKSSNPTLVFDDSIFENDSCKVPIVKSSSLTLTPFGESDFILEEIEDFLNDDSILDEIDDSVFDPEEDIRLIEKLLNADLCSLPPMDLKLAEESKEKSSIEEPPELELKDLPSHLDAVGDSAKFKNVNEDVQIQALVDGKKIIITEASIRRDLQLQDAKEQIKTNQAAKIKKLKKRVNKLEDKKKKRTHGLKRLYKVVLGARVESYEEEEGLGDQKDASKQRRIAEIDADEDLSLINKTSEKVTEKEVSTTDPVTTVGEVVTTADVESKSFEEVQQAFNKTIDWVNNFVAMDSEEVEGSNKTQVEVTKGSSKRARDEIEQKSAKRQRLEKEDDIVELKRCTEIVPEDDDDVAIEATPLSSKFPTIMFKNFNREDLEVLWSIVKERFKKTKPVDDMDNLLFQTLKTMFEHLVEDNIWKYQQGAVKVYNWKLFYSCGMYCVRTKNMVYYLLVEKMYPFSNNILHQLWKDVRLQVDYEMEMAYDLLRLIKRNLKIQKVNIKFRGGLMGLMDFMELLLLRIMETQAIDDQDPLVNYDNDNENDDLGYQLEEYFNEVKSAAAKMARSKSVYQHTMGRGGYALVKEKM
nr:reverse transcriptase domain-containing protein [Tanacetum cinerariifolium]